MMMKLLEIRARIRSLYQKFETYIDPVIKFIVAFVVFQMVNNALGSDPRLTRIPIVLVLSLLSAFTPSSVLVFLAGILALAHIYVVSPFLAILAALLFVILYLFFIRFTPGLGYVLVAVPILKMIGIPYVVPLLMGLFVSPLAIIPTGCGVIIYYLFQILRDAAAKQVNMNMDDLLQLYIEVMDSLLGNKEMFLTIAVFAAVIIVVYLIRKLKFDYIFEIAIALGAVVNITGFLIVDLRLDISGQIGKMVLGTIGSAVIVYLIYMFRQILDYSASENVQFEDDSYYYFVKAVPKMDVTVPQFHVKRISGEEEQEEGLYEEDYQDEYSEDSEEGYYVEEDYVPDEEYDSNVEYEEEYPEEPEQR